MSDFPTLIHHPNSSRAANDGHVIDYGDDGVARVRVLFEATQWVLNLALVDISADERDSLLAHYAANRLLTFPYTWPGDASIYTCQYLGPPQPVHTDSISRYSYAVTLHGVAAA